jgi:hypothetical protein
MGFSGTGGTIRFTKPSPGSVLYGTVFKGSGSGGGLTVLGVYQMRRDYRYPVYSRLARKFRSVKDSPLS